MNDAKQKKSGERRPVAKLKLLGTTMRREHGYFLIRGFVINVGNENLKHVVAVADYLSSGGMFIKKSSMVLDDITVQPNQVSSFSIATEDRPDIGDVKISFKLFFGKIIESIELQGSDKKKKEQHEGIQGVRKSADSLLIEQMPPT